MYREFFASGNFGENDVWKCAKLSMSVLSPIFAISRTLIEDI